MPVMKRKLRDDELLRMLDEHGIGHTARFLGVAKQTIDNRVNRARARLGKMLEMSFLEWYDRRESELPDIELVAKARRLVRNWY